MTFRVNWNLRIVTGQHPQVSRSVWPQYALAQEDREQSRMRKFHMLYFMEGA